MDRQAEERKKHNAKVLAKLKRGESLSISTPQDSWWPDRSKGFIKKDLDAIEKLYNIKREEKVKPTLTVVKFDQ